LKKTIINLKKIINSNIYKIDYNEKIIKIIFLKIFILMNLNKYNPFSKIRNDLFQSNLVEDDKDSSFNSDLKSNIYNNILIPWEPNSIIISNENFNFDNDNYGFNLDNENNRINSSYKAKTYFTTRKERHIPKPFLEKEICILFKKMNTISKETKIKFISCLNKFSIKKEEIKDKLALNPSKRRKNLDNNIKIKNKFKAGRKLKNDVSIRTHNKYSYDNLVDKIKNMINTSLILFCNKVIKAIYENNTKIKLNFTDGELPKKASTKKVIKEIDKNFIVNKKKGNEILELLNMTVKDYLCNKISSKYSKIPSEYNELIINQLLLDDNNKDIFDFLFNNLRIEDYLNIFLNQKEFKDIMNYDRLNEDQKQILNNNNVSICNYLEKIYIKDECYFQCLVILIYNFRRYLMNKERRNRG